MRNVHISQYKEAVENNKVYGRGGRRGVSSCGIRSRLLDGMLISFVHTAHMATRANFNWRHICFLDFFFYVFLDFLFYLAFSFCFFVFLLLCFFFFFFACLLFLFFCFFASLFFFCFFLLVCFFFACLLFFLLVCFLLLCFFVCFCFFLHFFACLLLCFFQQQQQKPFRISANALQGEALRPPPCIPTRFFINNYNNYNNYNKNNSNNNDNKRFAAAATATNGKQQGNDRTQIL